MTGPDTAGRPTPARVLPPGFTAPPDVAAAEERLRLRPGKLVLTLIVLILVAWVIYQLITNPGFQWDVVGDYMFSGVVLDGLVVTLVLTALTMLIACVLGALLALMRLSHNAVMVSTASVYVWFFRGTPALVQLVFWYNLAVLFPTLGIGIPFGGPMLAEGQTNAIITPFLAALLGLGLNEAAYMAEIIRGGLLSVDRGQLDASAALGMSGARAVRRIVLPQAMRSIVPSTGNQTIGMLKYTSLASTVSLGELLRSVQDIYSRTFQTIPLLIVAALWYLIATTVLSVVQGRIERHYSRGERQPAYSILQGIADFSRRALGRRPRHVT